MPDRLAQDSLTGRVLTLRPGRRLSVAVSAPPSEASGPTVLFLHGAGGRKDQWRAVWPALSERATLAAWDAPGHGASPPSAPRGLAGVEWVEDALALLAVQGAAPAVLVGHSYGCRIALGVMARLAERGQGSRVSAALLLAPPPPDADLSAGPIAREPLRRLVRRRLVLERGFRQAAWSPAADPALVDREERRDRRNRLSTMRHLMRGALRLSDAVLATIDTPVSILAGADDALTPAAGAQALAERLPRASCTVLDRCAHQIMLERPDAVLAALDPLLG